MEPLRDWNAAACKRFGRSRAASLGRPWPRYWASTTRPSPAGSGPPGRPAGWGAKPQPGPAPGLTDADLRTLAGLLAKGAKAHGWPNALRTAARVTRAIEREFGIRYHPEHVREILRRRLGWTGQKPRRKARERNDQEVARWVGDEFPRIVREAFRRKAHVVFLDESGFFLTPTVRRTVAPRGETPVLDAWDRRDRLSAISAITVSPVAARPSLYSEVYPHHIHGEQVVAFLADLRRRLGPLTVVRDRGPIHDTAYALGGSRWPVSR